MFLGDVILSFRLSQPYTGSVQVLAWQRALLKKHLAAGVEFLCRVQRLLRILDIGFGFTRVFRQSGSYAGCIGGLGLLVCGLIVELGRSQVAFRQPRPQLTLLTLPP